MLGNGRISKRVAIAAFSLIPAAFLGVRALTASYAGESDAPLVYSIDTLGKGAYLGVMLEEEIDHPEGGARITRVVEESPAERAGLETGDIVIEFEGRTIRGPVALTKRIGDLEPGDEVTITVVRDGRERSFDVELGARPGLRAFGMGDGDLLLAPHVGVLDCDEDDEDCEHSFSWSCSGDDCESSTFDLGNLYFGRRPMLGVQLVNVTKELREHLGSDEDTGILVSKIIPGSPAEDAGIEVGDLIVAVDGETIADVSDIRNALRNKEGETFEVEVIRDGRRVTIDATIPEREDDRPTGPRAMYFAPRIDLHGLDAHIDRAMVRAREAFRHAASLQADVRRQLGHEQLDAMRKAREALRDARRLSVEAKRDSMREAREAFRRSLATRNLI